MEQTVTFACDTSAFSPEERVDHVASIQHLFARVREMREVQDGYAFSFSSEPDALAAATEFVVNEQRCCPFFSFTIKVAPAPAPLVLELTGPTGVKPFILAELGGALPASVRRLV